MIWVNFLYGNFFLLLNLEICNLHGLGKHLCLYSIASCLRYNTRLTLVHSVFLRHSLILSLPLKFLIKPRVPFVQTVHGMEYGFGAHDFPASGVFEVEPRCCPGFIYRSSISLGRTSMSQSEFRTFIERIASEYHGDTYHLITKNCNHFTDDIASRLTDNRIPGWVNRLARAGMPLFLELPFFRSGFASL